MKATIGIMDRLIRVLAAIAIGILYWSGLVSGLVAIVLGVVAVVFILTSLVSFCPLYAPFKLSTKKSNR